MVDATLAGTIMVSATLQTPSAAFASSASMTAVFETRVPAQIVAFDSSTATAATPASALETEIVPTTYTVVRGDNLWRIAERYLGDGFRWRDIWKLNQQRTMTDGRTFVDPNLIYPGWILELPRDAINPEPEAVSEGDSLDVTPELEPTPEPSPVPPTPSPTPVAPAPTAVPGGQVAPSDDGSGSGTELRPSLPSIPTPDGGAMATAAAITFGGAAMLLVFRRLHQRAGHPNGSAGAPASGIGRCCAGTGHGHRAYLRALRPRLRRHRDHARARVGSVP
ncbi:MAG: LysM peptidoglycan-binding domain-containing protein [Dehalococcoidia bacterium]|nr:LysM peptidoglycan-binding domain-containing protein [Dehalococcoidia bacterium]